MGDNAYTFYRHLHARAASLNLDMSHWTGSAHQRGMPSPSRVTAKDLLVHDPTRAGRVKAHRLRRAMLEIGVPYACAMCGAGPEWQGGVMTLEVDHINGDISDNRPVNVRFLCPNCHAITVTYCRKRTSRPDSSN